MVWKPSFLHHLPGVTLLRHNYINHLLGCSSIPVSASPSTFMGSKKCTWGPSYWCQNYKQAKECKAMEHCREKVWKLKGAVIELLHLPCLTSLPPLPFQFSLYLPQVNIILFFELWVSSLLPKYPIQTLNSTRVTRLTGFVSIEKPLNLTACLKKSLNCDRSPRLCLKHFIKHLSGHVMASINLFRSGPLHVCCLAQFLKKDKYYTLSCSQKSTHFLLVSQYLMYMQQSMSRAFCIVLEFLNDTLPRIA